MKSTTTTMRHVARAGAEIRVHTRRRVLAPTRPQGPAWLAPAYRTTDVHRSASGRPPV